MDLADSSLYHAFFFDALAVFHYLYDDPERNRKLEMDSCFCCDPGRYGNAALLFDSDLGKDIRFGLTINKPHLSMLLLFAYRENLLRIFKNLW